MFGKKFHPGKSEALRALKLRLENLEERQLLTAVGVIDVPYGPEPAPVVCAAAGVVDEAPAINLTEVASNVEAEQVLATTGATEATTWTVTSNLDDGGAGTLRYAINNANDDDKIVFDLAEDSRTITLGGTQLKITKSLTIDASNLYDSETGTPGITIDANQKSRVMHVGDGKSEISVEVKGLTLANGYVNGKGGGVYVDGGKFTSTNTTISGNHTSGTFGYGGGVYIRNKGTFTATNTTISGNYTTEYNSSGGGVYVWSGTFTATNTTISGNYAKGTSTVGGGVRVYTEGEGTCTLYNSIVSCNHANSGSNIVGDYDGRNNCVDADPGFKEAPEWDATNKKYKDGYNLHLKSNSALIDAGENEYVASVEADRDGNYRIRQGKDASSATVDIGAYESVNPAYPTTITVTTNKDVVDPTDGKISLREAIQYAAAGDTILFDLAEDSRTITLAGTQLEITKSLTIDASELYDSETGTPGITIDANQKSRVMYVNNDTDEISVEVKGLTLANGCVAGKGGGVYVGSETFASINTIISGNYTTGKSGLGGGVYIDSYGTFTSTNTTISGNKGGYGGGVCLYEGSGTTFTSTNTTISGNYAVAVEVEEGLWTKGYGGGVCVMEGTFTSTNTTISGNYTGDGGYGGGVCVAGGTFTSTNTTISGNYTGADGSGGGVYNYTEYTEGALSGERLHYTTLLSPAIALPVLLRISLDLTLLMAATTSMTPILDL